MSIKQYFKVRSVSHKPEGNIRLWDNKGNSYKIIRETAPFLKVGDVFEGKPVIDMKTNTPTVVVIRLLTEEDSDVIVHTFPPKPPQDIKTP